MSRVELTVPAGEIELPAVLRLPESPPRAGVVTLHPASGPARDYFLFEHLASLLVPRGFAVLSYDRRAQIGLDDVPFEHQADDALASLRVLREQIGAGPPIGIWGFSQGTWAAPIAATRSTEITFLVLVGAPGVSPAQQMRYSAAEALRRAGYDDDAVSRAVDTRVALEGFIRRGGSAEGAQRIIDGVADEPWFELLHLPRTLPSELPKGSAWTDMDFDPAPVLSEVRCPVLLVYGDDEAVPVEQSVDVWRSAGARSGARLDVVLLPRSTHLPTVGGEDTLAAVDPEYEQALVSWLDDLLT